LALSYTKEGEVTDRLKDFYRARAQGGAAFIGLSLSLTRLEQGPFAAIYDDRFIPGLKGIVKIVHEEGAKIFAQFGAGYYWSFDDGPVELVGPSGISLLKRPGTPFRLGGPLDQKKAVERPLTSGEIRKIVESYGEAARRAQEAGFDAIELLASTGYMISRFISPLTNKRTDQYGGPLENRLRFLLEIIEEIKRRVGSDYPLMCRISGAQLIEGGYTLEDNKSIARLLEKAGICAIDVIGGGWHEASIPSLTSSVMPGANVYMAEEIKRVVSIPVVVNGRITDPLLAEEIISQGKADMVSLARALLADPELPKKAKEGRVEEIRPCICCCRCFETVDTGVICSANPMVGREGQYRLEPASSPKKVVVIGGGPAGMEAATVAAKRGHKVTLYEKEKRLGGQLLPASIPPYKKEIVKFRDFLDQQTVSSRVELKLGQELTLDSLREIEADVLIIATGASPSIPPIPGIEADHVFTAIEVLTEDGDKELGEQVIIIGGGMVGCETAEYLAHKGKKITILEMLDRLASDIPRAVRWELLQRLRSHRIGMETGVRVTRIEEGGVVVWQDGTERFIRADSVVLAAGMEPKREWSSPVEGEGKRVFVIGDQYKPQKIAEAIEGGLRVALEI